MRKVLFISPHLDDVVFSCAARIVREVGAGAKVTVATVFSHARPRSESWGEYVMRREEDRQALRLLGAKPVWLGLFDAPSRNPFYNSFRRIILETAPGDIDHVLAVRTKISQLLNELTPDAFYLPLGVGAHIDHRLVFVAASSLATTCPCYFYEDLPYAMVRHSVSSRFQQIQAAPSGEGGSREFSSASNGVRQREFLKSFRSAPYVTHYLPRGGQRRDCEAQLCENLAAAPKTHRWLERETEMAPDLDQNRILPALYAYRSQARLFLGNRTQLRDACRSRARWFGFGGWRIEHFWKPLKNFEQFNDSNL